MKRTCFVSFPILFFLFLIPLATSAQVTSLDIDLSVSPNTPEPFSVVTFELESYIIDLNRFSIRWYKNGEFIKAGTGERIYKTQIGASGSLTHVEAQIVLTPSDIIRKQYTVQPATVDIVWQTIDGYAPPFYRGKLLPSLQSQILFTALPDASLQGDSVYTWKRDFTVIPEASGYQQNVLALQSELLEANHDISVTVSERSSARSGLRNLRVNLVEPMVLLYQTREIHPSFFDVALQQRLVLKEVGEVSEIIATPYFFSLDSLDDLSYKWLINYAPIETSDFRKNTITLNPSGSGQGQLGIEISHPDRILQSSKKNIAVSF